MAEVLAPDPMLRCHAGAVVPEIGELLLKKSVETGMQAALFSFTDTLVSLFFGSVLVRDRHQLRPGRKEPHQPFQILCHRRQVKLFAYELDPA